MYDCSITELRIVSNPIFLALDEHSWLTLSPVDPPYGGVEYQLWQKKSEKSPDALNFKVKLSEHAQ